MAVTACLAKPMEPRVQGVANGPPDTVYIDSNIASYAWATKRFGRRSLGEYKTWFYDQDLWHY